MKNRLIFKSFEYAWQGLKTAFITERNFKIHCAAAFLVVVFGLILRISAMNWVFVFLAMGFVFVCELVNTAGENLVDMITKEYSAEAKRIKDLLAGAVLVSAITAVFVGIAVFAGPVLTLVRGLFH